MQRNVRGFEEGSHVQSYTSALVSFARFLLTNPCCQNLAQTRRGSSARVAIRSLSRPPISGSTGRHSPSTHPLCGTKSVLEPGKVYRRLSKEAGPTWLTELPAFTDNGLHPVLGGGFAAFVKRVFDCHMMPLASWKLET